MQTIFLVARKRPLGDGKDDLHLLRSLRCRALLPRPSILFPAHLALIFISLATASLRCSAQASASSPAPNPAANPAAKAAAPLPDAPQPTVIKHQKTVPCRVIPKNETYGMAMADAAGANALTLAGISFAAPAAGASQPGPQAAQAGAPPMPPCTPPPIINWFNRFLNGPEVKPLTPKEKARLALKNLLDPFNAVTILGQSAIAIGSDSHSPYGPGMPGFAKNVGVSYTQDMTGEFFGTFLIPSIMHQDPHYHRMPKGAIIPRRILHAIVQVVWTQGDNGRGMLNYSNLLGYRH